MWKSQQKETDNSKTEDVGDDSAFMKGIYHEVWGHEPQMWRIPCEHMKAQGERYLDVDVHAGLTQFDAAFGQLQSFLVARNEEDSRYVEKFWVFANRGTLLRRKYLELCARNYIALACTQDTIREPTQKLKAHLRNPEPVLGDDTSAGCRSIACPLSLYIDNLSSSPWNSG